MTIRQDLHCLLRQKQSSEKVKQYDLEIITSDPSKCTMDNCKFIVHTKRKNTSVHKGLKYFLLCTAHHKMF